MPDPEKLTFVVLPKTLRSKSGAASHETREFGCPRHVQRALLST
jgi:hypothetical protein